MAQALRTQVYPPASREEAEPNYELTTMGAAFEVVLASDGPGRTLQSTQTKRLSNVNLIDLLLFTYFIFHGSFGKKIMTTASRILINWSQTLQFETRLATQFLHNNL